jgi:lysozyme
MNGAYLKAIQSFEGFTPVAKWDYAQHSNGYGTKARFTGEVIDEAEAAVRFADELKKSRSLVDAHAGRLDEGTKAALTSLTFNAGTAWMKSGLGQAVAAGDLSTARELFLRYDKAGGQVLAGLSQRRAIEASWIGTGKANPVVAEANDLRSPMSAAEPAASQCATAARSPATASGGANSMHDFVSGLTPQSPVFMARLSFEPATALCPPETGVLASAPFVTAVQIAHLQWLVLTRHA